MLLVFLLSILALVLAQCPLSTKTIYDSDRNLCYYRSDKQLIWDRSLDLCESIGFNLVSIHSQAQNDFIQKLWPNYGELYIGAVRSDYNSPYRWTDGSVFDFTNWRFEEPIYDVALFDTYDGTWYTAKTDGAEYRYAICASPAISNTTTSMPTATSVQQNTITATQKMGSRCATGWTLLQSTFSCYSTYFGSNWNSAEFVCQQAGAHLTSIHSYAENEFVAHLAKTGLNTTQSSQQTWIGLNYESGSWGWSDGSNIDFIDWAPREPTSTTTKQCVMVDQDTLAHFWQTDLCSEEMRAFVCKRPALN